METRISQTELASYVFTHSHNGIIVTDPHGTIIEVNRTFTETTGYSRSEVLGKNPRFLQSGAQDNEFYARLWRALRAEGIWQGKMINRHKDGRIVTELLTISEVRDREGCLSYYTGIFSNTTALKHYQQ